MSDIPGYIHQGSLSITELPARLRADMERIVYQNSKHKVHCLRKVVQIRDMSLDT
jgi:hypothetical protein